MAKEPKSAGDQTSKGVDPGLGGVKAATAAPTAEAAPTEGTNAVPAPASNTAVAAPANTKVAKVTKYYGAEETGVSAEQMSKDMALINAANDDNIEMGELQISRLSIGQPGVPEIAAGMDGWKQGMLFDNLSRESLSVDAHPPWLVGKVDSTQLRARLFTPFVPIMRLPTEYVLWPTKEEREAGVKQYHWKTLDLQDPRVREGLWPPKGTWVAPEGKKGAPPVTEHLNVLGLCLNMDGTCRSGLIVASFSRTSFPTGRKLVTACAQQRLQNVPFWGRVYYLFTEPKKFDQGTAYLIQFAKGPKLLEFPTADKVDQDAVQEVYNTCYAQARMLADPARGKALQELYINAAQFDSAAETDEGGPGDGSEGTDDPNF